MGNSATWITTNALVETLDLHDRPEVLGEIKFVLREAASEVLDLGIVFSRQDPARITDVRNRVRRNFPNIFEDPSQSEEGLQNRMKCAIHYAEKAFNAMRHSSKAQKENQSSVNPLRVYRKMGQRFRSSSPYVPTNPGLLGGFGTQRRRVSPRGLSGATRRNTVSEGIEAPTDIGPDSPSSLPPYSPRPSNSENPPNDKSGSSNSPPESSEPPSATADVTSSGCEPITKVESTLSTQSMTTLSPSSVFSPPEHRIGEVAAFLRACTPNMLFLLNSFVSYGCRNRQFLAAMAKWDENAIEKVLKKIIAHTPPTQVHSMDLDILVQHLKSYFAEHTGEVS